MRIKLIIIVILCLCMSISGCGLGGNQNINSICNDNSDSHYSFLSHYSDVGTYEFVKQYEKAGGDWYSKTNDISNYAWSQCLNVWNSYIRLYEISGDYIWLEKLSGQIDGILDKRDVITHQTDRNGFELPSWSYTTDKSLYKPYHNPVVIGLIVYPMLRFAEIVKNNNIERYQDKANKYLKASIDALSVLDMDVNKYDDYCIPLNACQNMWRERTDANSGTVLGYYVGHNYYNDDYHKKNNYVSKNPLPYNQSLAVAMCYPVLYRILGDSIWLDKARKSWNWFKITGFNSTNNVVWWYYSEYYNWCRTYAEPIRYAVPPDDGEDYYEDYDGHYSIDLMFIIEAHKIGIIDDSTLAEISINKKMGLSVWSKRMNIESNDGLNLKAAVYFDYFVKSLKEKDYLKIVIPALRDEIEKQYVNNVVADNSTKINGTCLRLAVSAYAVENNAR